MNVKSNFTRALICMVLLSSGPRFTLAVFCQADAELPEGVFELLENHTWEKSYDTLRVIDEAVIRSTTDNELRQELEERFIYILKESKNPFAIQYACRQIYLIGTEKAVPAVEPWLTDPDLSHMARYALVNIDHPSAGEALRNALGSTKGKLKAGIVQSLAQRNDRPSLDVFTPLLEEEDKVVALAAIRAVGMTGNRESLPALRLAQAKSPEHYTESVNAILMIAERMAESGETKEAGRIYRSLYEKGKSANIRMAGLKGLMTIGSGKSEKLLIGALSGTGPEIRGFAGRLISDPGYKVNTETLTRSMKKLPPEGRVVLISALGRRKAVEAKPAILDYGHDPDEATRVAVVQAIGFIGNAGDVSFLAKQAAGESKLIANAATVSMSQLPGKEIDAEITSLIRDSEPDVQAVLITSLTNRAAAASKKSLLPYLSSPSTNVRKAVLEYLRRNGTEEDLQLLIDFMGTSENRSEIRQASRTVTAICSATGEKCEEVILNNLVTAEADLKSTLLENLNLVNTPAALETTIELTRSADPEIQKSAVRTLSSWQDSTAMDELREIMNNNPDQSQRILAFRGYFRLFKNTRESDQNKMREYGSLIQNAERKEEKILVLSAFQEIGSIDAMKRIEKYLYDEEMSHETCVAILRITDFLDRRYNPDIAIAMMQIRNVSGDENVLADVRRRFNRKGIDPSLYYDTLGTVKPADKKRIVFISGPMDHAWYGAHEYPKDLLLLKKCIENSPDMKDYNVEFHLTTEAPDLEMIEGAVAIVAHSSADRAAGEVHSLFPNNREDMNYTPEEKAYYKKLDKMVKNGMGVVTLHYSVWTDFPESRNYMSQWVGGYYDDNVSRVRMDSARIRLESKSHPVNNGVSPWHLTEEYYINQVYNRKGLKFIPLVAAELPLNRGDEPAFHTMGWAVERKDGGRGIGYTGCHSHDHLYHEDYRKFVVNAIAWAAGAKIPKNGIRTGIPEGWNRE